MDVLPASGLWSFPLEAMQITKKKGIDSVFGLSMFNPELGVAVMRGS